MAKMLPIQTVADKLDVTAQTVKNYISRGCLKAHLIGGRYYVNEDTLSSLFDSLKEISDMQNQILKFRNEVKEQKESIKKEAKACKGTKSLLAFLTASEPAKYLLDVLLQSFGETVLPKRDWDILRYMCLESGSFTYDPAIFKIGKQRAWQIVDKAIRKLAYAKTYEALDFENVKYRHQLSVLLRRYKEVCKENDSLKPDAVKFSNLCGEIISKEEIEEYELLQTRVTDYTLSVRVLNVLYANDIVFLEDLVNLTDTQLRRFRFLGAKSRQEIYDFLSKKGLRLGMDTKELRRKYAIYISRKEK